VLAGLNQYGYEIFEISGFTELIPTNETVEGDLIQAVVYQFMPKKIKYCFWVHQSELQT